MEILNKLSNVFWNEDVSNIKREQEKKILIDLSREHLNLVKEC